MKLFVDRNVKGLFCRALAGVAAFGLICSAWTGLDLPLAKMAVPLSFFGAAILVFASLYGYFRRQHEIMESACARIRSCLSGDPDARLDSDEEGELYRLFHEVNSLISILNAHAENERRSRTFLKDAISDISHQLKTPLAALNIYNGILQGEAADDPALREFTDLSEQELDRIETLVQNLLKITKLDAGAIVLDKSPQNLSELMGWLERRFSHRALQEGKELLFSGSESVSLSCDRTWLTEAVGNLVKNAFDHTKPGDSIRVCWQKSPMAVQIRVSDTGSGIHPEDMPHIFKRFYRSRFSKDIPGIGLGLPLAKAIVEAHGGTLEADSAPGQGSSFLMNFLIPTKL